MTMNNFLGNSNKRNNVIYKQPNKHSIKTPYDVGHLSHSYEKDTNETITEP